MEGHGTVPMYAASRAVDLQALDNVHDEINMLNVFKARNEPGPVHESHNPRPLDILLLGTCDPSSLIKTLARARRHPQRHLNFYVLEPQAPLYARLILLLLIATEPNLDSASFSERAAMFLELYGSLYIRERTQMWLMSKINDLIRIVTDAETRTAQVINVEKLKFAERDDIEFTFKYWKSQQSFLLDNLWEARLLKFYASRYDARENICDWDFNMKMSDNSKYLTKSEFVRWRMSGIAFEVRESTLSHANRTLASANGLRDPNEGITMNKWGYFSDVATGPFVAWSLDSENKELLKLANDVPKYKSTEIAHQNLTYCLAEMHTGRPDLVNAAPESNNQASEDDQQTGTIVIEEIVEEPETMQLPSFTVHLLPIDVDKALKKSDQFDVAVVGMSLAHRAGQVAQTLRPTGTLLCETARWFCELNNDQKGHACEQLKTLVESATSFVLAADQARKLHEKSGKWDKLGNSWDYLVFTDLPSSADTLDR